MKNKILATGLMACAIGIYATPSKALIFDPYVGGGIGIGQTSLFDIGDGFDSELNSTMTYSGFIGAEILIFRAELEYDYIKSSMTELQTVMANAYISMPTPVIKPYFGLGLGVITDGKVGENLNYNVDTNKSLYQIMAGLAFDLPAVPFVFDVEARIKGSNNMYYSSLTNDYPNLYQMELRGKVRYMF